MTLGTKYLTEATMFKPAADNWAKDYGFLSATGLVRTLFTDNNLSDLTDTNQARINLGLRIGYDVQAYSSVLDRVAAAPTISDFTLNLFALSTKADWTTALGTGTVFGVNVSGGTTGLTVSGGPITTSGTLTLEGVLLPANGGTGVTSLAALKTALNIDSVSEAPIDGQIYQRKNGTWVVYKRSYNVPFGFADTPAASQVLLLHVFTEAISFPANWVGAYVGTETAPAATFIVTLQKNGVTCGTISVATDKTVSLSTNGAAPISFAPGDILKAVAPATADGAVANFCATLRNS